MIYWRLFSGGFVIMGLELLAPRIVAPHFGTAVYTWASAIALSLLALAIGYWASDFIAKDKIRRAFTVVFSAAAGWIAVIALARTAVAGLLAPLDLRLSTFIYSAFLLVPPLTALAMVGPLIIRGQRLSAGRVFALSTIGSFLGAMLTGFVLVPYCTVTTLLALFAALALTAAVPVRLALVPALLLLAAASGAARFGEDSAVRLRAASHYGEITVVERGDNDQAMRLLSIDGIPQSVVMRETQASPSGYLYYLLYPVALRPQPGRALVIGLGAGSLPKLLGQLGQQADVVEINPVISAAARDYFAWRGGAVIADGRQYRPASGVRYDLVCLDAFSANETPWHLFTREALAHYRALLTPAGVLAVNTIVGSDPGSNEFCGAFAAAGAAIFRTVRCADVPAAGDVRNRVWFFTNGALPDITSRLSATDPYADRYFRAMRGQFFLPGAGPRPLTDEWAPVTELCAVSSRLWRDGWRRAT